MPNIFIAQGEVVDEEIVSRVHLGEAAVSVMLPRGDFNNSVEGEIFVGLSFGFLRQLKIERPVFWGVGVSYAQIGGLKRTYETFIGAEAIDINGKMASNSLTINLIGRACFLSFGRLELFAEGHFGGKLIYSFISEDGYFSDGSEYSDIAYLKSDFSFVYGGAVGAQFRIYDNWYILTKGSYQVTTSSEYYKRKSYETGVFYLFPKDGFEIANSSTDNLKIDIGLSYIF